MLYAFSFLLLSSFQGMDVGEKASAPLCLAVDEISSYKIIEKNRVAFLLKSGPSYVVRVEKSCPDLGFHDYVKYIPVDGQLCKSVQGLITREGFNCKIIDIEKMDAQSGPDQNPIKEDPSQ